MKRKITTIPPEFEGEYTVRIVDMPVASPGLVLFDDDDHANVYLNARYNRETNENTADHEFIHLINDDIHNADDIRTVEARADGLPAPLKSVPRLMKARDLLHPSKIPHQMEKVAQPQAVTDELPRSPSVLSPHQSNVLLRAVNDLDDFLFHSNYDYDF